ncbi:MAG: hypothetical protein ACRD4B_02935 [Acidobacteriota bacterium]
MFIEIHGSEDMLQQLRLNFEDELQNAGYGRGPRLGSMDAGRLDHYIKEGTIVSIQITEESEAGDSAMKIETETEASELYQLWDTALIAYCRNTVKQILDFAHDKKRVEQEMK